MKIIRLTIVSAALAVSAPAIADEGDAANTAVAPAAEPIVLSDLQMDRVAAGDLGLPNGKVQFVGFDNAAPNVDGYFGLCNEAAGYAFCHPSLTRRSTQVLTAQAEHYKGPTGLSGVNEGAWSAAFQSPAIELLGL